MLWALGEKVLGQEAGSHLAAECCECFTSPAHLLMRELSWPLIPR